MRNLKANVLMFAAQQAPAGGSFCEIGCIREIEEVPQDGFSTVYLANHCRKIGAEFYCIDCNRENIEKAKWVLLREGFYDNYFPKLFCRKGEEFLNEWTSKDPKISFLYLDSHRDPQYSFNQFIVARDKLMPDAVIAIDDAHEYDGFQYGKATYLIDLFNKEGISYKILPTEPGFKMVIAKIP